MGNGHSIYCDCCGTEKLAEVVGDNLIIKDRRHGERHVAVIGIDRLLDILKTRGDNNRDIGATRIEEIGTRSHESN